MTKNVTVTDETGKNIGTTYPKRARGLVKNGRALYVDDCTIRLSARAEPSDIKSEGKQMNYLFFNPREWYCSDMAKQNIFSQANTSAERSFASGFDGELVEILMLGGWNTARAEIVSKIYSLMPDTEYCFVFWLNGGENENQNEVCQLRIAFSGHTDGWNVYKLNRNFIKPILHYQGWELYAITFKTPEADSAAATVPVVNTQLGFLSGAAPMAVQAAKEPDFYKNWEDSPDEFAGLRPQRHNIVFEDGWPSRNMYGGNKYSTEVLREQTNNKRPVRAGNLSGYTAAQQQMLGELGKIVEHYKYLANRCNELAARRKDMEKEYLKVRGSLVSIGDDGEDEAGELDELLEEMDSALTECQELLEEVVVSDMQDSFGNAEDSLDETESLRDEIISRLAEIKTKASNL